jgi:hypothetical protein
MTDVIAVRAGWASTGEIRELMSPGLAARVAQADAEDDRAAEWAEIEHRARWQVAHERAVDEAARQKATAEGIPLREAMREVGHTKAEFLQLASARMDLEDAQRVARQRQALRHAGIDPDSGEPVDVPGPSELQVKIGAERAVMNAPADEFDAESAAQGIRGRWLRRNYRRME